MEVSRFLAASTVSSRIDTPRISQRRARTLSQACCCTAYPLASIALASLSRPADGSHCTLSLGARPDSSSGSEAPPRSKTAGRRCSHCSMSSPLLFFARRHSLGSSSHSLSYFLLSTSSPGDTHMPITEQEAFLWSGTSTADQLSSSPRPRITRALGLSMLDFSTSVIHCFYGGPHPPLFAFTDHALTREMLQLWCDQSLRRDETKRRTVAVGDRLTFLNPGRSHDEAFLRTFGHRDEIRGTNVPFLRVSGSEQLRSNLADVGHMPVMFDDDLCAFEPSPSSSLSLTEAG
jgi:hypothetical protein